MGWRMKFVLMLIVYFAGFATAVYCLSPTPEKGKVHSDIRDLALGKVDTRQLTQSLNSGMHRAVDLGKDATLRAAEVIRKKVAEAQKRKG